MISNNTTYKIKTSKSPREIYDYEPNHSDDNCEVNSIDGEVNDSNNRYQGYYRDGRYRGSSRSRTTEFRPSWNNERRGGSRGRGRRNDSDNYYILKKYHETPSRGSESTGTSYHGKFYEPDKKNDTKLNLPEDTRISKLLRRLSIETDQEHSLAISKKLLEVLLLPDNAIYIRKAFHILGESMYEILQVSPGLLAKQQAARALGRMGYIMGQENDFDRYQTWLFTKMSGAFNEELQMLLMETLKETLTFERKTPMLQDHVDNLMANLVSSVETMESASVFKVILDVLMTTVEIYPDNFYSLFRDTTDLLFGWHVDHTQPLSTIEFISLNMQRISKHFQFYLEFSVSLVENFLEDISNFSKQYQDTADNNFLKHVTVLILALNTVLKCLGPAFHPADNKYVKVEFVNTCLQQIIKTATETLISCNHDNLIIASNDCIAMLLTYLDTKSQTLANSVYTLLDMQLLIIEYLPNATVVSILVFISRVLKELSANLPAELIEKLVGPNSEIVKLRHSPYRDIQESVICVYQALLNLKNVSLVQEAYRYVIGDLEVIYKGILVDVQPFIQNNPFEANGESSLEQNELTALFLLRCLSQLANASSIIVMWALKPSILELLAVNLEPYHPFLAKNTPNLQYNLLFLLYSHCKCYNHYISTSNLVIRKEDNSTLGRFLLNDGLSKDDVPHSSPNSGNFAIILDTIYKTLTKETNSEVTLLLLQWISDILIKSENYLINLYNKEKFLPITDALVRCGYSTYENIILAVCDNLTKLLGNKQLSWGNVFLNNVTDLCKLHMNSNKENVRHAYSQLASFIPWDVAVVEFNKVNSVTTAKTSSSSSKDYNSYMVVMAQYLHLNGVVFGELSPLHFRMLMNFMLGGEYKDHLLENIFVGCLSLESDTQMNMDLIYDLGMNSRNVLYNWATLEAAQFCVNSKLRTPLGKPIETFTKIEGALFELGNDLITIKSEEGKRLRVKLLLQFVDHLEKSIYNAAEGCAVAMPQAAKQVRSFFITNSSTCDEWLFRIRMVVIHVSLHAGESHIALRHGHLLLKDYANSNKVNTTEFERAAMFVTIALLNLRETEAIYGLYVWCKNLSGKRYSWIKCAAEQCSKRYELAIEGYKRILNDAKRCEEEDKKVDDIKKTEDKKLDMEILNFVYDQILICYQELNNWPELMRWQDDELPGFLVERNRKYWFYKVDWECASTLFNLDLNNQAIEDLKKWDFKQTPTTWSSYDILSITENNLNAIALTLASDSSDFIEDIDTNLEVIQKSIQNHLNTAPSDFLQNFSLLQYVANGLKNVCHNISANAVFLVSENFENEIAKIDSSVLRKILWWSEYFGKVQNQGFNIFCSNLRLDIIKRARKEKNFNLAYRHIQKFLVEKDLTLNVGDRENFIYLAESFTKKVVEIGKWNVDIARAVTEIIKLSYMNEDSKTDTFNLCAAASTAISKYAELYGGPELRKISSKILLNLASWMQSNENTPVKDLNSPLGKLLMVLPDISANNVIPMNEMAVGKLLQFSVHQCVGLAKNWSAFGTWCYRWGRKIVDHSTDIREHLTSEDCLAIKNILPPDTEDAQLREIFQILSQTRKSIDEEDIDSNDIQTSEMIQNQLQNVSMLRNASEVQILGLVQIWKNIQKRIYTYYGLSAEAYFKYLHLVSNFENMTKSSECNTITVTLRLLRLIVKHALELQNILEEGLQTTPTQPWKVIIPQLFSRLNHPEGYVRQCVSDLLCRVAEDAPHLITFPAVVGALEGGVKFDFSEITLPKDCLSQNNEPNENEEELNDDEDNYDSDVEETTNTLQTCFKSMVDTLSKQDPETIAQVQTLVKELRRITLLWDELWLGTLAQHQSEINKRQHQLQNEIDKVNENPNLTKEEKMSLVVEKHRIIIKPIIFILEQLRDVTNVEAETPHEKQFQERYSAEIDEVIDKLKKPDKPDKPQESFQPLKALQKKFQQKFHKRASYSLKMQEISPILASIKDTLIAMPGFAFSNKTVTISHVSNVVSILPTKTKPKKLVFYGSDGQTYTYLFKGLEDLHLDERIMQFLSIANTMMAQNADPTGMNLYRARHYSVIPLGPRSGLINWVDGTTPMFSLYKRWQQRENAKPSLKNNTTVTTNVLRPSELFYKKLFDHGVKNIENRKEWPLSVLKDVLLELMAETPSDLLAKEFWCNSISASDWWQVVKRYSYSVAVMSIIGYIIGLGDRHLDNVLVDLTSGEVVHIDYNVCFEKGKTLRVPEKVPFRLTPNIREALGVTGVEGIFRLACENVLKTMRKGRETLLTLLEAFVYDPLIDWTVGGEVLAGTSFGNVSAANSKQSRKELEKEITLAMFNVRCMEMRVEWRENRDEILTELKTIREKIDEWLALDKVIGATEDNLQDLHQQMALVKEAEAHGSNKHHLYNLPARYDDYYKTKDAMKTAKKDLDNILAECQKYLNAYQESLITINSQEFMHWCNELKWEENDLNIFDLVREFLHNAGKDDVVTQCEQSETEVGQLAQHHVLVTKKCSHLLQEYQGLLSQCPKSYMENHKVCLFFKWASFLIEHPDVDSCDLIYEKFKSNLDANVNSQFLVNFAMGLDAFYKEVLLQVNKLYEEMSITGGSEPLPVLDKAYNAARSGVSNFLSREKNGDKAFTFVITTELLILNRNLITLEKAAHRSGDWLIKLTSRDGDWFLDDLVLNSSRAVDLINNLPLRPADDHLVFYQIIKCVRIANIIYTSLHDLYFNFHTIILPESMKKIQSEDPSVLEMITDLQNLIVRAGVPIPEMITQLLKILPCLLMQMDINSSQEVVLEQVNTLKIGFLNILNAQTEGLSTGKMLLMGFNGLFDKLSAEWSNLISAICNLNVPNSWKKVDQVKDAKSIAPHIVNPKVNAILDDIFLLKRIQVMVEFFNLSVEMCQSFKGVTAVAYSDEQLVKPIKQFIADFISRQLLGITTENICYVVCYLLQHLEFDVVEEIEQRDIGAENKVPIDDLYHKAWNLFLKRGLFSQNILSQASTLESNIKHSWVKIQEAKKLQQKLTLLQSTQLRLHGQITMLHFMYEEILVAFNIINPVRSKFLLDLKNELAGLKTINEKFAEVREKQSALIESAHQRLNWAKGANPNVGEISAAFECAVAEREQKLDNYQKVSSNIADICATILQHELFRAPCIESKIFDEMFLNSFKKWRCACRYSSIKTDALTQSEESIIGYLTPELVVDPKWLMKVAEKISQLISKEQKKLSDEKAVLFTINDSIISTITDFKNCYNTHCRLMSDVKNLIKSMAKIEGYSVPTQKFIMSYRQYIDTFSPVFNKFKKEITREEMEETKKFLIYLDEHTEEIYEALLALEVKKSKPSLTRQDGVYLSPMRNEPHKQDSLTKGQQRNAYAVSVWRRVKMKLEGRDPDPGRKYTAQEQVDYVIREASSLDNLALLYEGWTPWV